MKSIPYGRQHIDDSDIQSVIGVLQSDWLTQGKTIDCFEEKVAEYCGVKYAVAVSSATAALHIACLSIGLGEGDILWTVPNTFVASANCARYCGAEVDFVDIDPKTYNMSVSALEEKLALAKKNGKLPKAIIPVHFSGQSCDMEAISALASANHIMVVEDAAHAIGAEYRGQQVGSCKYSDMTVFSFHPVKIITTGEGGMVLTNRKDLYDSLRRLRSHGITRESELLVNESQGDWYYEQLELGYHYRMTDIQAALGISQLDRLPEFLKRRRELATQYDQLLAGLPLVLPYQSADGQSSYHLYPVQVDSTKTNLSRKDVFDALRKAGVNVQVHYIPVYQQPYYRALGFTEGYCSNAEAYYAQCISLPMYYSLSDEQQSYIVDVLKNIFAAVGAGPKPESKTCV